LKNFSYHGVSQRFLIEGAHYKGEKSVHHRFADTSHRLVGRKEGGMEEEKEGGREEGRREGRRVRGREKERGRVSG